MSEIARLVYNDDDFLCHYGVKDMKWGVRHWQYPDGSLTPEGRIHYGIGPEKGKNRELLNAYSNANLAGEVNEIRKRGAAAEDRLMKSIKPAFDNKRFFESKEHYKERHDKAWAEYEEAKKGVEPYRAEEYNTYQKHQERFELYVDTMDELEYLFTTNAKLSDDDRIALERQYADLGKAVERYINADMGYDPGDDEKRKFNSKVERVLYNEYGSRRGYPMWKTPEVISSNIQDAIKNNEPLNVKVPILDRLDTSEISGLLRKGGEDNRRKAERIASEAAKQLLGEKHANDSTPWSNLPYMSNYKVSNVIADYLIEKSYAESTDDPKQLETMWSSFSYYDVSKKLNDIERKRRDESLTITNKIQDDALAKFQKDNDFDSMHKAFDKARALKYEPKKYESRTLGSQKEETNASASKQMEADAQDLMKAIESVNNGGNFEDLTSALERLASSTIEAYDEEHSKKRRK